MTVNCLETPPDVTALARQGEPLAYYHRGGPTGQGFEALLDGEVAGVAHYRRRDGRINVYVVSQVDGSSSRGQACEIGGSFVALVTA